MSLSEKLLLYAVTDGAWGEVAPKVEAAIEGGATFVQLREKHLPFEEFAALARRVKEITRRACVPLVINDNIDVALAAGADGVHVGQSDAGALEARKRLGSGAIVGVSASTLEEALLAERQGADYLGVGAMFKTPTKPDAADVSLEELRRICAAVSIPVVAIGGIDERSMESLRGCGTAGIAVVSAIFAAEDCRAAANKLRKKLEKWT